MGKYKKSHAKNKFKIPAPMWNDKFKLPDESYSASYIKGYFEYILKKYGEKTDNLSTRIYVNKIENGIRFKIKTGYHLQILTPNTMKLLGNTNSKRTQDENGKNVIHLEINEVVLVHCNIVNNDHQHDSNDLFIFIPNKSFSQLVNVSP